MIASGYSMDLYCDVPGCASPFHPTKGQYFGETWGECVAQARGDGWSISKDKQQCACPRCMTKGKDTKVKKLKPSSEWKFTKKVNKGEVCPSCKGTKIKYVGCNPDGIRMNCAYDCLECGAQWEGE